MITRPQHGRGKEGRPLRVLALAHEASLSGAIVVHLAWLQWAAARPERFAVRSVLARGGALLAQWPANVPVTVLGPLRRRLLMCNLLNKFGLQRCARPHILREAADVVLINTLTLGWLLPSLGTMAPVVVHAHELAKMATRLMRPNDRECLQQRVAYWVAVSAAGQRHLVEGMGIKGKQVSVVRNFVPPRRPPAERTIVRNRFAVELGLPTDRPWIVAIGHLDTIKGPELFVDLAQNLTDEGSRCNFIWVGGGLNSAYGRILRKRSGADRVIFVGARSDSADWLVAADFIIVTSVEESCSLVALEAMQVGTPVIAFSDSGGPDELLAGDAGYLVPERSATALARAVKHWLQCPADAKHAATIAQARVKEVADYDLQCEEFASVLESVATRSEGGV